MGQRYKLTESAILNWPASCCSCVSLWTTSKCQGDDGTRSFQVDSGFVRYVNNGRSCCITYHFVFLLLKSLSINLEEMRKQFIIGLHCHGLDKHKLSISQFSVAILQYMGMGNGWACSFKKAALHALASLTLREWMEGKTNTDISLSGTKLRWAGNQYWEHNLFYIAEQLYIGRQGRQLNEYMILNKLLLQPPNESTGNR